MDSDLTDAVEGMVNGISLTNGNGSSPGRYLLRWGGLIFVQSVCYMNLVYQSNSMIPFVQAIVSHKMLRMVKIGVAVRFCLVGHAVLR